ncbi:ATP/GTP-binding protein [Streptomyces luteireticuli]|uniref:ATP/GTP-binding protein n=1 Tax=Streptomyces luteireticuli TaxID=173858 RepID=UPI00355625D1
MSASVVVGIVSFLGAGAWTVLRSSITAALWIGDNPVLTVLLIALVLVPVRYLLARLARRVARRRVRVRMEPGSRFDPDAEQIWRQALLLARAATTTPWWVPRRARTVRVRLRADGTRPLDYLVEGPAGARHLLTATPYKTVQVATAQLPAERKRKHEVRAEFVLRGNPARRLRDVPLEPDPLQPLVDAVATVRTDLGDRAELCLDLQPVPRWRIVLQRRELLAQARDRARREASAAWRETLQAEDTWRHQLARLLGGDHNRRLLLPPRPRPVDDVQALGRIGEDTGLLRIQLLVRCSSDQRGRAKRHLHHIAAALETFTGGNRISQVARRIGPFLWSADSRPYRRRFDRRWSTGQITGLRASWARADEIAGLLKPPTLHCRLPLLTHELPEYRPGGGGLMPHGWYTAQDGTERLIATPLKETLFSLRVGRSGYGKTEQALVQAVALAHAGEGLAFVDPHGDALKRALPYLAHRHVAQRMWHIDLAGDQAALGTWNLLGVERGQRPEDVVRAVCDAFATVLGWSDSNAPRALTILAKATEALVALNAAAVATGRPEQQATLFQIPTLLTDPLWRTQVLSGLPEDQAAWWFTAFPQTPADALPTVLNPIERLAANPAARTFLSSPTSTYNIRQAMDEGLVVWICPRASGPTDRLLVSLLLHDLFRAGLSRRDTPESRRRPFHAFVDELISVDSASSSTLAAVSEELRKFGIRLHAMTQLLQRISTATRDSLLQNASTLSSTSGAIDAVAVLAKEWGNTITPPEIAELPRYHHYITLTVDGRRIGPLRIRGPELDEVFHDLARPRHVHLLRRSIAENLTPRALPAPHSAVARQRGTPQDSPPPDNAGPVEPRLL